MAELFFTKTFRTDGYDDTQSASFQGQLSSSYTAALTETLTANSDWLGFLAKENGADTALAIKVADAIAAGNFTLSGLFSAAQSKTDEVNPTDPEPTLTVNIDGVYVTIDLKDILGGLDIETWTQTDTTGGGKKAVTTTTVHSREFYTTANAPEGYVADWRNEEPEGEWVTDTIIFDFVNGTGPGSSFDGAFDLLGDEWQNVELTVTGTGDFDWNSEGVEITGDVEVDVLGLNAANATGKESLTTPLPETTVVVIEDAYDDGVVTFAGSFTNETQKDSTVTLTLTYEYWL